MSAKRCKSQTPDSAEWVEITGYRFRYQINREAVVRKELESGEWYVLKPYISGRTRACVKMRTADNRKVDVPVVWLMADAFMGGRRPGYNIIHRNGAKMDCELVNLSFASKQVSGKLSSANRRKAVMKVDQDGQVVAIYSSGREAAKKNYISQNAIWARCTGKVKDPYRLDGYGAPTSRKRFVLIARCDGKPVVWPEPTHAPRDSAAVKSGRLKPWRSAAEIIDWSLPCPSIFDIKEEIKERYNLKAVRPLADNTMRRIIRGVDKFTIKSGQPYIVPTGYGERKGQAPRVHDIEEPLPTVVGSGKHNLCKPVLAPFTATNTSNSVGAPAGDPVHTVTTAGNQMLVTPYLAECNHAGGGHIADVRGPYKTITAKHTGGIVAPSLIQYHTEQTENVRASGLGAPIPTVDASNRYGLTCANLVKYYSGVVGEKMEEPLPTVTAIDHNAVCAAHVVKFKGDNLGSSPAEPMQTVTAGAGQKKACGGGTFALCDTLLCKAGPDENLYRWPLIRELLNRYCGYKLADDDLLLLSIGGTLYFIADIGLRMLSPRELYNAMGFPPDYIIDRDYMGNPYPKNEQVARCGNAVCPPMAAAVARANFPEYVARVGDTITTMAALLDMVAV